MVVCEVPHRRLGDLHVNVRVPGQDAAVPPPAHQGAVHDPGLGANVVHGGDVGLEEGDEVFAAGVHGENCACEAAVVVGVELWEVS